MPVFSSQNYDLASFMNISVGFAFELKAQGRKFQSEAASGDSNSALHLVIPLALSCFSCPIVLLSEQPPQMAGKKMATDHIKCFPQAMPQSSRLSGSLQSKCQGETLISPA